ncbi:hypothetical protein RND81_10G069600 [Saponaria officinalis]|uniref:Uncharacterized protein n=1 Tax=Saponaria officinalis TaxID=3572 RepID=A0AAW1I187_SAPOF
MELGSIRGIRVATSAPEVTHLLFADDCIIFVQAKTEETRVIKEILKTYEKASGQVVSLEKTIISFSQATREARRREITDLLGVRCVDVKEKYLGLPIVVGRSKKILTNTIRDKLWKRLQGWKGMLFSKAGREVLIKAVAQSIPTYAMSVFKIPAYFCDEIRKIVSHFWWGQNQGVRKVHWIAWKNLCRPKEFGGLGFQDYQMFNWALLGKQVWSLCTNENTLAARVIKGKYYPNSSFLEAQLGRNPSYTWRGFWEAKWVVEKGLRNRIGDGAITNIWTDAWLSGTNSGKVLSPKPTDCSYVWVKDLLKPSGLEWDEDNVRSCLLPFEAEKVTSIRISERRPPDEWF